MQYKLNAENLYDQFLIERRLGTELDKWKRKLNGNAQNEIESYGCIKTEVPREYTNGYICRYP